MAAVKVSVKNKHALMTRHIGMDYIKLANLQPSVDKCEWRLLADRRGDTNNGKLGRVLVSFCWTKRLTPSTCVLNDYVSALAVAGARWTECWLLVA